MRFTLLGPVRVWVGDTEVAVAAGRDRIVLAALLLHAGEIVPMHRLIDAVWDERPPTNARNQIQGCVSRLRRRLAEAEAPAGLLITDPPGYRITTDPPNVDLHEFRRLRDAARAAASQHRMTEAREHYRAALDLWQGDALTGIGGTLLGQAAAALDDERVQALEECLHAELACGRGGELVSELTQLARQHPYREALHGLLMRALYRAGRQADALAAYRHARQVLHDELGIAPSSRLQELHQAVLRRDPALDPPAAPAAPPAAPAGPTAPVPRELPAAVAGFTGRTEALGALDDLLAGQLPSASGPVVISAIAGTAGVGKTALAIHWGHRVADRFPDGQLYLNLRGYAAGPPIPPLEALASLLRSLGTPPQQIPTDQVQAAALYRSRLAGKRALVVLDNAATADQVRPLLPGTASCLVVVTSRDRLSGLVARDGARRLTLDVLTPEEAHTLLTQLLGAERVKAEPDPAADLAAACAYLPLALRIAAASIGDHPAHTIADYVDQLVHGDRLATLEAGGDPSASVQATLDLSYRTLSPDAARLYRLLGLPTGPDIDLYGAAALGMTTLAEASRLVDQLLNAHLLQEPAAGRYAFHDLIRDHAAHTGARVDAEPERQAAIRRLLDYYRHTASAAMDVAHPYERERRPRVPAAGSPTPDLSSKRAADQWLDAEVPNLIAAVLHAAGSDNPEHTWQLAATLHRHLHTRGRNPDAETLLRQALTIGRTTGHQQAALAALTGLGDILRLQGQYDQAIEHYGQGRQIAREIGSRTGELYALVGLGDVNVVQGWHEQALDHFEQALAIARQVGSRTGELYALIGLGWGHEWRGRYGQAIDYYWPALEIARSTGNRSGELEALTSLGQIHRLQGRTDEAISYFEQSLQIAKATDHRPAELATLVGLADIYRLEGKPDEAASYFEQSLQIAKATGYRAAELAALRGFAHIHRLRGEYELAIERYQRVLDIAQALGDRNWQFEALQGLGRAQHSTSQPERALVHHQQALGLATELGQPADQARAHDGLAHACHALGQLWKARQHWQSAADILVSLGTDQTDDEEATLPSIRAHLASLDPGTENRSEPG